MGSSYRIQLASLLLGPKPLRAPERERVKRGELPSEQRVRKHAELLTMLTMQNKKKQNRLQGDGKEGISVSIL